MRKGFCSDVLPLKLAYMEKLRTDRWSEVAIVLQKNARRFIERRRYLKIIEFVVRVQQVARKIVGQARLDQLRREKAATVIQKNWRCHVQRKWYQSQIALLIQLQAGKFSGTASASVHY